VREPNPRVGDEVEPKDSLTKKYATGEIVVE
jgi:hypothetical protein